MDQNIRGYYDGGKIVINLGCYHEYHLLVSWVGGEGVVILASYKFPFC